MKKTSESAESWDVHQDELLRRLGIPAVAVAGEKVDVEITLSSSNVLTVVVTRSHPQHEVAEPAVHRRMVDVGKEPTVGTPRDIGSVGEQQHSQKTEVRDGHLAACAPWCQQLHPNLGGYQPGPAVRVPIVRGVRPGEVGSTDSRKPIPRDHSLDQEGPGDPI